MINCHALFFPYYPTPYVTPGKNSSILRTFPLGSPPRPSLRYSRGVNKRVEWIAGVYGSFDDISGETAAVVRLAIRSVRCGDVKDEEVEYKKLCGNRRFNRPSVLGRDLMRCIISYIMMVVVVVYFQFFF